MTRRHQSSPDQKNPVRVTDRHRYNFQGYRVHLQILRGPTTLRQGYRCESAGFDVSSIKRLFILRVNTTGENRYWQYVR